MKKAKISSLEELRTERRKLRLLNKVTKRELSHSVGLLRSTTKEFTLKKIALPLGAAGLGGLAIKKMTESGHDDEVVYANGAEVHHHHGDNSSVLKKLLLALVPIGVKMLADIKENQNEGIEITNRPNQVAVTDTE